MESLCDIQFLWSTRTATDQIRYSHMTESDTVIVDWALMGTDIQYTSKVHHDLTDHICSESIKHSGTALNV